MAMLRLSHTGILWVEEAYPMAAAQQWLKGRMLYRDLWFDKPPGFAGFFATWGAESELLLRWAGVAFVCVTAAVAAWAARRTWGYGGEFAAVLTAFFFTFDFPATVIALTPDLLAVPLHFAALALAVTGQPMLAGLAAGCALLLNTKALLIAAAAALFVPRGLPRLAAGFLLPVAATAAWLAWQGALEAYWQQVWVWGAAYSRDTFLAHPWLEGLRRTLNWAGFHAAILVAGALGLRKAQNRWPWAGAVVLALVGAWLGFRFFPRYYFHLLPPLVLLATAGLSRLPAHRVALMGLLLLVPLVRFGPRYVQLWTHSEAEWSDIAMERDSRQAAAALERLGLPGKTLLVWGYRPEIFVFTGLAAGTPYLDSQPLTGVLADRHLTSSRATFPAWSERNRAVLLRGPKPAVIADGLGPYNQELAVFRPEFLGPWQEDYLCCGGSRGVRLYCRADQLRP